ncbi:MAG: hypothetical protein IPK80_23650 [Nannocystis sp.]|nr:hypothetical protein [Nannocystis sp.]
MSAADGEVTGDGAEAEALAAAEAAEAGALAAAEAAEAGALAAAEAAEASGAGGAGNEAEENLLAGQVAGDSLVVGSGAAVALWSSGVVGWLGAIGHALLASVAFFFVAVIILAICNASTETRRRKLLGWAIVCGLLVPAYSGWLGAGSWLVGGGALLWTGLHTLRAYPRQEAAFQASLAAKAGAAGLERYLRRVAKGEVEALPGGIVAARLGLPRTLAPELRALVDAALGDFVHVVELLPEAAKMGADRGLREAAVEVMTDLLARAPQVSRLVAMGEEREADAAGRAAAAEAIAGLRRRGAALHDAASAALQLVARGDEAAACELREQVEALHALREAHDEVARALGE